MGKTALLGWKERVDSVVTVVRSIPSIANEAQIEHYTAATVAICNSALNCNVNCFAIFDSIEAHNAAPRQLIEELRVGLLP